MQNLTRRHMKRNTVTVRFVKNFIVLLNEELVTYYFQPIISAKTGKIEAYEALMRANLPILKRPDVVMKIAREEGALREIERMTMFRATEAFADLREKKRIKGDALLFTILLRVSIWQQKMR